MSPRRSSCDDPGISSRGALSEEFSSPKVDCSVAIKQGLLRQSPGYSVRVPKSPWQDPCRSSRETLSEEVSSSQLGHRPRWGVVPVFLKGFARCLSGQCHSSVQPSNRFVTYVSHDLVRRSRPQDAHTIRYFQHPLVRTTIRCTCVPLVTLECFSL